ncbi:UNVERIFIED_ORG: hypothetical protein ABIC97_005764 [Peribacillus simplex]
MKIKEVLDELSMKGNTVAKQKTRQRLEREN